MEAIFLQPVLRPWLEEWREDTGNDDKFFDWLGNYDTDPILSGEMHELIESIDKDMCKVLEGMLMKNPKKRIDIANALMHEWFEPMRSRLLLTVTGNCRYP